jgi:hypothetical protein
MVIRFLNRRTNPVEAPEFIAEVFGLHVGKSKELFYFHPVINFY